MFGSTRKIRSTVNDFRFDRKIPLFWCKMIFVAIFTSKYFQTQTRRERERERERERDCKPRNRLRLWLRRTQKPTPLNPENPRLRKPIRQTQKTHSIKPIKPIRQTQKTHSIAPSQTLIAPIAPPARLSHPSIDPPKIDCSRRTPKAIILMLFLLGIENLGFVSFVSFGFWWIWVLSSTQFRRPHSSNPVASLSQFNRIWWIFFVGICFFCVYLLRNDINICLEDEKMWEIW